MSSFLYVADTHVGGCGEGFQQQPRHCERIAALVDMLGDWIAAHGPVHGILHGGDMLDHATAGFLTRALDVFALPAPVYLCLGNHDLTGSRAASLWRTRGARFLDGGQFNYTVRRPDCRIHVVPNHWEEREWLWDTVQEARFSDEQLTWLGRELALFPDLPHILLTHSPAAAIPTDQTGLAEAIHSVPAPFGRQLARLIGDFPQLRLILGAHNHVNTHLTAGHCHLATVSSFVETPFEFKLIDVTRAGMTMSTHNLWNRADWPCGYDWDRAYVQGRVGDRAFADDFAGWQRD